MPRYEIKPYKEINRGTENKKSKGKKASQLYGIWDNEKNGWLLNTEGIGKQKALKILAALRNVTTADKIRPFWRE